MRNKILLIPVVALFVILSACVTDPQKIDKELPTVLVNNHQPAPSGDVAGYNVSLPASGRGVVFGNYLNNNNIVYSETEGCYYLSMPYYVDDWEGVSDSILAYKNKLGNDLRTFEVLCDDSFEQLQYANGKLYFISGGMLICREGDKESIVLDFEISNYCVDGNFIYYKKVMQSDVWRKEIRSDAFPTKLLIEKAFGYQASSGFLFFHDGTNVYEYNDSDSKVLCTVSGDGDIGMISSFLVDGIIIYKTESGDLFLEDGEKVAAGVLCYTIYHGLVYYSTRAEGLFTYDPVQKNVTQIIATSPGGDRMFDTTIVSINIQNDILFLSVYNTRFGTAHCIFTSDIDGRNYKPLINTETPEFQTFTYTEQGFSIDYPFGYTVHFDPGSYYAGRVIMIDIMHDFFISACNTQRQFGDNSEYFAGGEECAPVENKTNTITNQGRQGIYQKTEDNGRFSYNFLVDEVILIMKGPQEYSDIAESIFLEMASSLRIIE